MADRELNITIKADGSVAVRSLGDVDAAVQKTSTTASTAASNLRETGAAIDTVGSSAKKARSDLPSLSGDLLSIASSAAKLSTQFDSLSSSVNRFNDNAKRGKGNEDLAAGFRRGTSSMEGFRFALKKTTDTSIAATPGLARTGAAIEEIGKAAILGRAELPALAGGLSSTAASAAAGAISIAALTVAVKAFWAAAKNASDKQEGEDSFRRFSYYLGKDPDKIVESLRQSSSGTISDSRLMATASKAMALQVTSDAGKLGNLLEIARNKAKIFQVDVTQAFEDIVIGIGRASPKILDNLGIRIPAGFEEMTEGMTETEKVAKLLTLTLDDGNRELTGMGSSSETAADSFRRLGVSFENLYKSGGDLAKEILKPVVDLLTILAQKAATASAELAKFIRGVKDTITGDISGKFTGMNTMTLLAERDYLKQQIFDIYSQTDFAAPGSGKTMPVGLEKQLDAMETELVKRAERMMKAFMVSMEEIGKPYVDIATSILPTFTDTSEKDEKERLAKIKREAEKLRQEFARMDEARYKFFVGKEGPMHDFEKMVPAATALTATLTHSYAELIKQARAFNNELIRTFNFSDPKFVWSQVSRFAPAVSGGVSLPSSGVTLNTEELDNKALREMNEAADQLQEKLTVNVQEAFEDGLSDALNGGKFLETFGKALRSQVARALAASISSQLFQGGGSFVLGGAPQGPQFSIANPSTWLSAASTMMPSSQGSSGGGGLGGLLNFGPLTKGGQMQWGNLTQYAAAGAALSFLTSPGRLFGGTKVHGQEVVGQAADINTRVAQAKNDRQALIGTVGLSDDTVKDLRDLVFWTAGYNVNNSGDGWFKGPKTTTYELSAANANAALATFEELTKRAQLDVAKRNYDIGITQLIRPFEALGMSLDDLKKAIFASTDEESRYTLMLQAAQAEAQRAAFWAGNLADWSGFLISNPMAGYGPGKNLSYGYGGAGGDALQDPTVRANIIWNGGETGGPQLDFMTIARMFDPASTAAQKLTKGFFTPAGRYQVGETDMNPEEFESWAGTQIMMQGLLNQSTSAFSMQEQLSRGAKPWDIMVDGKSYSEILSDRLDGYQTIMNELDAQIAAETTTMEQRSQLFMQWQSALMGYFGARQESLDLELQEQEAIKQKEQTLRDDLLGTLLTRIGEHGIVGGKQVIFLAAGQPSGRAIAQEIIDAYGGENPELATALSQFIEQTARPYF